MTTPPTENRQTLTQHYRTCHAMAQAGGFSVEFTETFGTQTQWLTTIGGKQ